jgi:hypothetical protein
LQVVINCSVLKNLKYNQATPTFHQWRDGKQAVYGLNFSSKEDADNFAAAMLRAIEILNSSPPRAGPGAPLPPTPPQLPAPVPVSNQVPNRQPVMVSSPSIMPQHIQQQGVVVGNNQSPSSGPPPPPPPLPQMCSQQPIYQSIHGVNGDWDDGYR